MTKSTAVALTALLFWPTAGFLAFLIITMWLGAADKAPMVLQIIAAVLLLCSLALLALPIYCSMFLVSSVSMAHGGRKKSIANDDDGQESFADDSLSEEDAEQIIDEDLAGQATNEFETLEFSEEGFDSFDEDFAIDDDDDRR